MSEERREGPEIKYCCNGCKYLKAWANSPIAFFARCEKEAWDGIREAPRGECMETPETCTFIKKSAERKG